jgi:hypothetical protein
MLVCVSTRAICTRDRGCSAHPVFPAPSDFLGPSDWQSPGRLARRAAKSCGVGRHCADGARTLSYPPPSKEGKSRTRSPMLTNFWHCGGPSFSFRTGAERRPGNEPSTVLAEDCASKGSGNADSQLFVRSSGGSGARRPSPGDSGCVPAHPASWRASASYRPLRAVWAVGAWALRGSREITRSLPRSTSSAPAKGIFR